MEERKRVYFLNLSKFCPIWHASLVSQFLLRTLHCNIPVAALWREKGKFIMCYRLNWKQQNFTRKRKIKNLHELPHSKLRTPVALHKLLSDFKYEWMNTPQKMDVRYEPWHHTHKPTADTKARQPACIATLVLGCRSCNPKKVTATINRTIRWWRHHQHGFVCCTQCSNIIMLPQNGWTWLWHGVVAGRKGWKMKIPLPILNNK